MKRLVFFVAALFAVCLGAMAQPHASITSMGNYNTATIKQSAAVNWATIVQDLQTSDNNQATITQCYENSSYNHATVLQTMKSNRADVKQSGHNNNLTVEQWGNQGIVDLMQGGGNSNVAYVKQSLGSNNLVRFLQFGNGLDASIIQKGSYNMVALKQKGNGSDIHISQDGSGNNVTGIVNGEFAFLGGENSTLDVKQFNQQNTLRLWSNVPGADIDVLQCGIGNMATVYQGPHTCTFPIPTFPRDPGCENVH